MMHSHLVRLMAFPFGLLGLLSCGGRLGTSGEDSGAAAGTAGAAGGPMDAPARCDQEHGKMVLLDDLRQLRVRSCPARVGSHVLARMSLGNGRWHVASGLRSRLLYFRR